MKDITAGFAVATIDEAVELREAGITSHIIVLGYISPREYAAAIEHDIICQCLIISRLVLSRSLREQWENAADVI